MHVQGHSPKKLFQPFSLKSNEHRILLITDEMRKKQPGFHTTAAARLAKSRLKQKPEELNECDSREAEEMQHLTSTIKHTDGLAPFGETGPFTSVGGGEKTTENVSNDPVTCVWLCVHVSPRRRAPTRVPTGCEYVCRYAFAYVYAAGRAGRLFLSVFACAQSAERWGLS